MGNHTNTEEEEGAIGEVDNNIYDSSDHTGYEVPMWQAMFDCTNMSSDILKSIVNDIKRPTFMAKKKYRDALAYKEKWNIYRHSVCCEDNTVQEDTAAVIKAWSQIGTNIYRYAWKEVAIIPKAELGNFLGAGIKFDATVFEGDDDFPNGLENGADFYEAYVEHLNKIQFVSPPEDPEGGGNIENPYPLPFIFKRIIDGPDGENPDGETIDIKTIGDLHGEIYVNIDTTEDSPCYVIGNEDEDIPAENNCEPSWTNESIESVASYFTGVDPEGLRLVFHNDRYSPWIILEKPNGKGTSTDTVNWGWAYNTNEILNRDIYDEGEYPKAENPNVFHYQKDLPVYSDLTDAQKEELAGEIRDIPVAPGVNATKSTYSDYPSGFSMLPVGGYKLIKQTDGDYQTTLDCNPVPLGQIVIINSIDYTELDGVGIDNRTIPNGEAPLIFYFSVENAHDGNCDGCSL